MVITSLLLTMTTSISGCNQLATANKMASIKKEANEIILEASAEFDSNQLNISINEHISLIKHHLLQFNDENNLLDEEYLLALKENADLGSTEEFALNSFEEKSDEVIEDSNLLKNIGKAKQSSSSLSLKKGDFRFEKIEDLSLPNSTSLSSYVTSNSDGINSITNNQTLPVHSYNSSNVNSSANGKLDDKLFVGIMVTKDACVSFYNTVASFLNNQVMYAASGIKGPANMIIQALTCVTPALAATVIGSLIAYFSGLWTSFCSLFTAGGPVGIIVGTIIGLVGLACIAVLATMFVMGYMRKGFAVGWKVHNLFNWEWYCGEAN